MLFLVLAFFLLESVTGLPTTWVACVGSCFLLIITTPREIGPMLERIEWPTMFFFAYLFICVKLIERLGVIYALSSAAIKLIECNDNCYVFLLIILVVDEDYRLPVAMMCVMWMSALLACWCNNIAFTG